MNHSCHCTPQKHQVKPYTPVMNVPHIHGHALRICGITSTTHLPEARDSREYHVVFFNILFIPRHFFLYNRTGTYQGHFPLQYIEKLRKFIKTGLSKKSTTFRNTWIIFQFKIPFPFFFCLWICGQKFFQSFFRIYDHRAEFVAVEFFSILAHPALFIDCRSLRIRFYPYTNSKK